MITALIVYPDYSSIVVIRIASVNSSIASTASQRNTPVNRLLNFLTAQPRNVHHPLCRIAISVKHLRDRLVVYTGVFILFFSLSSNEAQEARPSIGNSFPKKRRGARNTALALYADRRQMRPPQGFCQGPRRKSRVH